MPTAKPSKASTSKPSKAKKAKLPPAEPVVPKAKRRAAPKPKKAPLRKVKLTGDDWGHVEVHGGDVLAGFLAEHGLAEVTKVTRHDGGDSVTVEGPAA
jgi:hypothetical protein